MTIWTRTRNAAILVVAVAAIPAGPAQAQLDTGMGARAGVAAVPAATASDAPVRLSFEKQTSGPGVWQGTVAGDIEGALTTRLLSVRVSGPIWHVTFDWIIDA